LEIIREIEINEVERFLEIYYSSYPFFEGSPEKIKKESEETRANLHKKRHYKYFGYYEEGIMQGIFIAYNYLMNFRGKMVDVGGIGSVGVNLLKKKEKICKKMVQHSISMFREQGKKFAVLYPFRLDFYTNMGFGFGSQKYQYSIEPRYFQFFKKSGKLEILKKEDNDLFIDYYNNRAEKGHGMIKRTVFELEEMLKNPQRKIMVYKSDNKIQGYMWFRTKKLYDFNFIKNNFEIIEMIYDDISVFEEFSSFLNTQADQFDRIIVNTHDEFFYHLVSNPSDGSNIMMPPVYHKTNNSGVGFMYRSLASEYLISCLPPAGAFEEEFKVRIKTEDDMIIENTCDITIETGTGKVFPAGEIPDAELEIKLNYFSSLIMGSVDLKNLVRFGKARLTNEKFLDPLNRFFKTEEKPVCLVGF